MSDYLWIGLGGAAGSMARFWCSGMVARHLGETFHWGTVGVNVLGSFLIGCFAALTGTEGRMWASPSVRQFFMFGVLGGYTTFSSFSVQTLNLLQEGDWLKAGLNIGLSIGGCLVAVWLGYMAGLALAK